MLIVWLLIILQLVLSLHDSVIPANDESVVDGADRFSLGLFSFTKTMTDAYFSMNMVSSQLKLISFLEWVSSLVDC
jgi:hypothetical protein